MTRNNLQKHLLWLCKGQSTVPSPSTVTPSSNNSITTFDSDAPRSSQSRPQTFESACINEEIKTVGDGPRLQQRGEQFAVPLLPASVLNSSDSEAMARLQSGSKSGKKPRLLSQAAQDDLQTPLARTRSSLQDHYNAGCNRGGSGYTGDVKKSDHRTQQLQTPSSIAPKARFSYTETPSIDLTAEPDIQTSSSSTIEAFGEPRALWREDSASRKDPLIKKGKKRKSDEFEFDDEFGNNAFLRLSQSSFTAIDAFPENTSEREEEDRLMIKDEYESPRKNYSSESKLIRYQDKRTNPDENLKQDIPPQLRTIGKVETCYIKNESEDQIRVQAEMSMSRGVAVADSEDEDEDMIYSEPRDTVKAESADVGFSTLEVDITKKEPSQEENAESGAKAPLEIPVPQSEHATFVASPFQRDSPTKFRSIEQQSHATTTSAKTSSALTNSERHAVQSFLCYDTYKIQKYLDSLHQSRRTAAEAIYNCLIEGGEPTDEMQKRTPSISAKINAIDSLLRLRDNYVKLTREKERIKSRMLIAIQEDHSMDQHTQDVAISIKLTSQLIEIEKSILELLVQATLPLADQKPTPYEGQKGECSRGSDTVICPTTLVQSTQSSQPRTDDTTQNPRSSAPPTMQLIEQTQIPNLRPHSNQEGNDKKFLSRERTNVPSNMLSPTKGAKVYSNTPKPAHLTDIGSGTVHVHDTADRREIVSRIGNWESELESRRAKFEEDDKSFMTHMGTPTRYGLMDEEFGEDGNDEDMLEFAKEFENRDSKLQPNIGADQRSVFTETSGNAVRGNNQRPRPDIMDVSSQSAQLQFKWSNEVKSAMKNRFRLHGFRPNQLEAVNATLAGKDAFVLMPTGGGKSLCYQLPSIIKSGKTRGVTVVISPLLSLMQDQVDHLQKLKIQALLFNGEVTSDHRRLVMDALKDTQPEKFVQLLYITPEMITKSQKIIQAFNDLYRRQKLARIVIDEAHCVSQWGHDFRPDYKQLGQVRRQFPDVPVMALTATATENVKVDVIHNLGIQGCEIFTQSFNRPNLTYEVRTKGKLKDVLENMVSIIGTFYKNQSGIIYCLSRQNCEKISERLQKDYQIRAHHYHAGMEPEQKSQVQKAWQAGKYHVIVATIAFGMGIDKADVRFVIHHTIPKSLEGYYQETGRAGRDGKRSGCYLFYGYQDTSSLKRMINDGEGSWEQKERQHKMLRNVIQFCENKSDCRRVQILNYFNESFCSEDCHGGCDNCNSSSTFESQDFTEHANAAINLVSRIQSHDVTLLHCVDVFRGHKNKKITDRGHHELQEFGVGSSLERGDAERLFYRLLSEDALMEHHLVNKAGFALQYVKLGKNSQEFSSGRRKVKIQIRVSPKRKTPAPQKPSTKRSDYPPSTNVSSPVHNVPKRRIVQKAEPESALHRNGYARDQFAVSDHDSEDAFELQETRSPLPKSRPNGLTEANDGSDSDFEPVRESGKRRKTRTRQLGPPITLDGKIGSLSSPHRMVVEDFMINAKKECEKIMLYQNLRTQPFTDTVLREMAINFPKDKEELLEIPGIGTDKVERHGERFLKLIRNAQGLYESLMAQHEDCPLDPNHQNVIDISSDDGCDNEGFDGLEDTGSQEEQSSYFQAQPDVEAFNARFSQIQRDASMQPQSRPQAKARSYRSRSSGNSKSFGNKKGWKRSSSGSNKAQSSASIASKRSTKRTSNKPTARAANGGGGIGMMPI